MTAWSELSPRLAALRPHTRGNQDKGLNHVLATLPARRGDVALCGTHSLPGGWAKSEPLADPGALGRLREKRSFLRVCKDCEKLLSGLARGEAVEIAPAPEPRIPAPQVTVETVYWPQARMHPEIWFEVRVLVQGPGLLGVWSQPQASSCDRASRRTFQPWEASQEGRRIKAEVDQARSQGAPYTHFMGVRCSVDDAESLARKLYLESQHAMELFKLCVTPVLDEATWGEDEVGRLGGARCPRTLILTGWVTTLARSTRPSKKPLACLKNWDTRSESGPSRSRTSTASALRPAPAAAGRSWWTFAASTRRSTAPRCGTPVLPR